MTQATQTPNYMAMLNARSAKSQTPVRDMLGDTAHAVTNVVRTIGGAFEYADRAVYTANRLHTIECAEELETHYELYEQRKAQRALEANAHALAVAQQMASLKAMNNQVEVSVQDLA